MALKSSSELKIQHFATSDHNNVNNSGLETFHGPEKDQSQTRKQYNIR